MRVVAVTGNGGEMHRVSAVADLLADSGNPLWMDIPECGKEGPRGDHNDHRRGTARGERRRRVTDHRPFLQTLLPRLSLVLAVTAVMSTLLLTRAERRSWW